MNQSDEEWLADIRSSVVVELLKAIPPERMAEVFKKLPPKSQARVARQCRIKLPVKDKLEILPP